LGNILQHTATHCNTIRDTLTCYNTLQHVATHDNTRQHTATQSKTLQHATTRGNTLQHRDSERSREKSRALQRVAGTDFSPAYNRVRETPIERRALDRDSLTATHCNTLQHTNTSRLLLYDRIHTLSLSARGQHTATHCTTLQQGMETETGPSKGGVYIHTLTTHCTKLQHVIETEIDPSKGDEYTHSLNALQNAATYCSTLQQVTETETDPSKGGAHTHSRNTLQYTAKYCNNTATNDRNIDRPIERRRVYTLSQHTATHCTTLQQGIETETDPTKGGCEIELEEELGKGLFYQITTVSTCSLELVYHLSFACCSVW